MSTVWHRLGRSWAFLPWRRMRLARASSRIGLTAPPRLVSERLILRPPRLADHAAWARLRRSSQRFLQPWEPTWTRDHLSPAAFKRRVSWAKREIADGRSYPFLIFRSGSLELLGGVTLEHVRRGAAMSAAVGYWLGEAHQGRGYMTEAMQSLIMYAYDDLDLSRLEAACLPENARSRHLLERCGFHEEGYARNYLQIDGAWRDHVLFERRRRDRL